MTYNFQTLLPADFEDLARDLVGRKLGVMFEGFGAGPDEGMDGRYAQAGEKVILQAKHLAGSSFATLKSKTRAERTKIDRLAPTRYLLVTSRALTPRNKTALAMVLGDHLLSEEDIIGPQDLNALLRANTDIARSHIKLWLTGAGMLEAMLRPGAQYFTAMTRQEVEEKIHVYAPNPSFGRAHEMLESLHVLIVAGPPGVGKSTLAEMLAWSYLGENWELVVIRSLSDAWDAIVDTKKQVFFFDDFLGSIALDAMALSTRDTEFARFMKRVRKSPNARFILTTRAHLFEEARNISEQLADRSIEISKFLLDVGAYTREIRARILYNHLVVARTPTPFIQALVGSGRLPQIIDHKNYSPRIVEWMTTLEHLREIEPGAYPKAFIAGLDDPSRLWDKAFREGLHYRCRHLLMTLFFVTDKSIAIGDFRPAFETVHASLCRHHNLASGPKDFEESLRILEGGFIVIRNDQVSYVNPSLRDYLARYLDDELLLRQFAGMTVSASWARAVWLHGRGPILKNRDCRQLATAFLPVANALTRLPSWRRSTADKMTRIDSANAERIDLLMTWCTHSENDAFADAALALAVEPPFSYLGWGDGEQLVELLRTLGDEGYFRQTPVTEQLVGVLGATLIKILRDDPDIELIDRISDMVEGAHQAIDLSVREALYQAIRADIAEVKHTSAASSSESTLKDRIATFEKLAPLAGVPRTVLAEAIETVRIRIGEIEDEATTQASPAVPYKPDPEEETFNDEALSSLFASLVFD